jgi:hypothetical protein
MESEMMLAVILVLLSVRCTAAPTLDHGEEEDFGDQAFAEGLMPIRKKISTVGENREWA